MEVQEDESDPTDYPNSNSWRKAEIPAANGHGTASGIAKFFGILASGGSRDGQIMLKPETIKEQQFQKLPVQMLFYFKHLTNLA